MRRLGKTLLLVGLLGIIGILGDFAAKAEGASLALLFDEWAKSEVRDARVKEFKSWKSASGEYRLTVLKSDRDVFPFVLEGRSSKDQEAIVLGHGLYGVEVTWVRTSVGEVAIIDHKLGGGMNELFVVKPSDTKNWMLLYRTPKPLTPDGLVIEQCYWKVMSLDGDTGSLRLKAAWSFSNVSNAARKNAVTEGVYEVPLFYGFRTAEKVVGSPKAKR